MRSSTKISLGLLVTWAISDIEELATMSRTSQQVLARLPDRVPVPGPLRRAGISPSQFLAVFGMMGAVMGTATVLGIRSEGRSAVFRGALLGFGVHGFGHLAAAAATRQYVSGAITAPTMVIPFWLWARRELARDGLTDTDRAAVAVAARGSADGPGHARAGLLALSARGDDPPEPPAIAPPREGHGDPPPQIRPRRNPQRSRRRDDPPDPPTSRGWRGQAGAGRSGWCQWA